MIVLALERRFPSPHPGQTSPGLVIAGQWRAASGAAGGGWPPAGPDWPGAPGQPPRVGERTAEQELDLGVGAAQLVAGPLGEGVVDGGSSRSRTLLRSVTAVPWLPSLVEGAGVDDRLGGLLAAQHHEQVGDHRGIALLIQLDDVLVLEPPSRSAMPCRQSWTQHSRRLPRS